MDTVYDRALKKTLQQARQVPVLINYSVGKKRYEKEPDAEDLALIRKIEESNILYPVPIFPMMFIGERWGDSWRAGYHSGVTHVHHFYTNKNLRVLSSFLNRCGKQAHRFILSSSNINLSKLYRFRLNGKGGNVSGTLYIPSTIQENNAFLVLKNKFSDILEIFHRFSQNSIIETKDSSGGACSGNSVDYIFIDPPFGGNLMYSELNFLWEAWLGVFTNNRQEAIINEEQKRGWLSTKS